MSGGEKEQTSRHYYSRKKDETLKEFYTGKFLENGVAITNIYHTEDDTYIDFLKLIFYTRKGEFEFKETFSVLTYKLSSFNTPIDLKYTHNVSFDFDVSIFPSSRDSIISSKDINRIVSKYNYNNPDKNFDFLIDLNTIDNKVLNSIPYEYLNVPFPVNLSYFFKNKIFMLHQYLYKFIKNDQDMFKDVYRSHDFLSDYKYYQKYDLFNITYGKLFSFIAGVSSMSTNELLNRIGKIFYIKHEREKPMGDGYSVWPASFHTDRSDHGGSFGSNFGLDGEDGNPHLTKKDIEFWKNFDKEHYQGKINIFNPKLLKRIYRDPTPPKGKGKGKEDKGVTTKALLYHGDIKKYPPGTFEGGADKRGNIPFKKSGGFQRGNPGTSKQTQAPGTSNPLQDKSKHQGARRTRRNSKSPERKTKVNNGKGNHGKGKGKGKTKLTSKKISKKPKKKLIRKSKKRSVQKSKKRSVQKKRKSNNNSRNRKKVSKRKSKK